MSDTHFTAASAAAKGRLVAAVKRMNADSDGFESDVNATIGTSVEADARKLAGKIEAGIEKVCRAEVKFGAAETLAEMEAAAAEAVEGAEEVTDNAEDLEEVREEADLETEELEGLERDRLDPKINSDVEGDEGD